MDDLSLNSLRSDELIALQSIYAEDFRQVESPTAWKSINAVNEFIIRLTSSSSPDISISVHYKIPAKYPTVPPTFTFIEPQNVPTDSLPDLKSRMVREVKKGQPMVFDMNSQVVEWLDSVATRRAPGHSLEEEKLVRERLREEELNSIQQAIELERQAALKASQLERMRILTEASSPIPPAPLTPRPLQRSNSLSDPFGIGTGTGHDEEVERLDPPVRMGEGKEAFWIKTGGRIRDSNPPEFDAELIGGFGNAGKEKWKATVLHIDVGVRAENLWEVRKILEVIMHETRRVSHIKHPNLHNLHSSTLTRLHATPYKPDGWRLVQILDSKSRMLPLLDVLRISGPPKLVLTLEYVKQICLALKALHSSNFAHRSLRLGNILIEGEKKRVKVANSFWFSSLIELHANHKNLDLNTLEEDNLNAGSEWFNCNVREKSMSSWKEKDIFDLGICLAQMLFGTDIIKQHKSAISLLRILPSYDDIDPSILELLNALLRCKEPGKKLAISKVLEMVEFSMDQLENSSNPAHSSTVDRLSVYKKSNPSARSPRSTPPDLPKDLNTTQRGPFWQPHQQPISQLRLSSRYLEDFEELPDRRLGKGAFGEVVKARNKLDGNLYAIKKVKLPQDEASQVKVLREVTAKWPRMNHIYIVRYHASWVETVTTAPKKLTGAIGSGTGESVESDEISEEKEGGTLTHTTLSLQLRNFPDEDFLNFDDPSIDEQPVDVSFIRFGNEEDDDEDSGRGSDSSASTLSLSSGETGPEESEDGFGKNGRKLLIRKSRSFGASGAMIPQGGIRDASQPVLTKYLYIQMELIENITLRDAIDTGKLTSQPERAWKFFRQMLMAMENFMSINIIHRDLKPSNILIDKEDNIKIGDFGLAIDADDEFEGGDSYIPTNSDMTGNVGTTFYIAPEVKNANKKKGSSRYTIKADMYSLGIIFFEMFHHFETGMERMQVLKDLGSASITLPKSWTENKSLRQHTEILRRCLTHDPNARASPTQLLNSDLLPPLADDELIVQAVREIGLPKSTYAKTLLNALFNSQNEQRALKEYTYDYQPKQPTSRKDLDSKENELMETYGENLKVALRAIFRKRGAVELNTHPLMPFRQNYDVSGPVRLLDEDSNSLMLAPDMVYPFCRMVAREEKRNRFKRWSIAPVFRAKYGIIEQPRWPLAASYDIVCEIKTAAAEAECLSVVDEVLDCVAFSEETIHLMNHHDILDCILHLFNGNVRDIVLSALQGQKFLSFESVISELRVNNIPQRDIEYLQEFNFYDDLDLVQQRIFSLYPSFRAALAKAFDELREINKYSLLICKRPIKICPLLPYSKHVHRGAVFQTVLPTKQVSLAVGGRYDHLVHTLRAPNSKSVTTVVGVSFAFSRFAAALEEHPKVKAPLLQQVIGPSWRPSRCDVYVVSLQGGLFNDRLEILKDLWDHDISGDIMYETNWDVSEMLSICRLEGVRFMAILKPKQSKAMIKVKDVETEAEEEVPRATLHLWLRERLSEIKPLQQHPVVTPAAHTAEVRVESPSLPDVQVILPPDQRPNGSRIPKHRVRPSHTDKQKYAIFSERAVEVVKKASAAFIQQAPIFAIDVEPQTFWNITTNPAWISNEVDFKKVVSGSVKRSYLAEIRDQIKEVEGTSKWCWIFNSRDNKLAIQSLDV